MRGHHNREIPKGDERRSASAPSPVRAVPKGDSRGDSEEIFTIFTIFIIFFTHDFHDFHDFYDFAGITVKAQTASMIFEDEREGGREGG